MTHSHLCYLPFLLRDKPVSCRYLHPCQVTQANELQLRSPTPLQELIHPFLRLFLSHHKPLTNRCFEVLHYRIPSAHSPIWLSYRRPTMVSILLHSMPSSRSNSKIEIKNPSTRRPGSPRSPTRCQPYTSSDRQQRSRHLASSAVSTRRRDEDSLGQR